MTQKQVVQLDKEGYFVGFTYADESPLEPGVFMLPSGCIEELPPEYKEGFLIRWVGAEYIQEARLIEPKVEPEPEVEPEPLTQFELDQERYQKRAYAKDHLVAYMAADNMSRVRSGAWTVPDLVSLTNDPAIIALLNDVNTLSFELAVMRLADITHALLTPEIKATWTAKLVDNYFN